MPEITRHEPGSHCWSELATSDPAAAKKFYTSLFGWEAEDTPAGPDMIYTMLRLSGREVGALYQQDKAEADHGVPPHWNVYVAVESADATAARAKELGGSVLMEPFEVMEHGRMTIVQDPTGATICAWQARKHIGARVENEIGAPCWVELYTKDTKKAGDFYSKLFGWTPKESPGYTEFHVGARAVGGMMAIEAEWGPMPPHWMVYVQVADPDATAQKARSLRREGAQGADGHPRDWPLRDPCRRAGRSARCDPRRSSLSRARALQPHGRVAVVTGAGSGIGKAVALALLEDGYHVALAGRRPEPLEQCLREAGPAGERALAVPTDVTDPVAVRGLFERTTARLRARRPPLQQRRLQRSRRPDRRAPRRAVAGRGRHRTSPAPSCARARPSGS